MFAYHTDAFSHARAHVPQLNMPCFMRINKLCLCISAWMAFFSYFRPFFFSNGSKSSSFAVNAVYRFVPLLSEKPWRARLSSAMISLLSK